MQISSNDIDLELPLSRIVNMVNKAAEADLNGVIPIVLAVEERYFPVWQPPFKANKILARDETQFSILFGKESLILRQENIKCLLFFWQD